MSLELVELALSFKSFSHLWIAHNGYPSVNHLVLSCYTLSFPDVMWDHWLDEAVFKRDKRPHG